MLFSLEEASLGYVFFRLSIYKLVLTLLVRENCAQHLHNYACGANANANMEEKGHRGYQLISFCRHD